MTISEIFIRTTVAFIVLYILCRTLNKKLISQMTFFDFVAGITIGSIAASLLLMQDLPLWIGVIGLILFSFFTFFTNIVAIKSLTGRKVLEDEPTYLIKNGQVLEEGLKKTRMTMDSLLTNLRKKDVFYVDQVESALLETDGTVSVLKKPPYLEAMQKDVQHVQASRGNAQAFIVDGRILEKSLELLGKDRDWVDQVLQEQKIVRLEDVFFAQVDQLGNIYIDTRKDMT
ncbi:DUF421 domain-containing protein [Desertibacillus haloalkaliphilus]|uniref:DUF421 domain-containing protein n=1 Tax=Desertibacillus haloalkaliphilus TaxID=1328930 RepID=UPI001C27559F|nr:DUF421 domain-containing protein [Desertibacillus haloalkaliphilus]MBU8907696.1 DUF421 domain-containing protein [Desertibacillus haloalkaliphilus]